AIEQQLRTSNKALSDYFTSLFGQRLEPWHADSEVRAVAADFDMSDGKGLVAAPEDDLIARHAPRSTAPIMLAQSMAEEIEEQIEEQSTSKLDDEWDDADEHVRTTARKPSKQDMALLRPTAAAVDQEATRNERRSAPMVV